MRLFDTLFNATIGFIILILSVFVFIPVYVIVVLFILIKFFIDNFIDKIKETFNKNES